MVTAIDDWIYSGRDLMYNCIGSFKLVSKYCSSKRKSMSLSFCLWKVLTLKSLYDFCCLTKQSYMQLWIKNLCIITLMCHVLINRWCIWLSHGTILHASECAIYHTYICRVPIGCSYICFSYGILPNTEKSELQNHIALTKVPCSHLKSIKLVNFQIVAHSRNVYYTSRHWYC